MILNKFLAAEVVTQQTEFTRNYLFPNPQRAIPVNVLL